MKMKLAPKSDLHFYNCENKDYRHELEEWLKALNLLLTKKQMKSLVAHKLQFERSKFDIDQYIQSACEFTVMSRMYVDFKDGFEYEPKHNKSNPEHQKKDIDFSFNYHFLQVNVEVKCFSRLKLQDPAPSGEQGECRPKSRFLPLKDFFKSANEKFRPAGDFESNILVVCCYNLDDFVDVANSLAGSSGVCFRKNRPDEQTECIFDVRDFDKVDGVIVTNLAFLHENFNRRSDGNYLSPWDFTKTFTMGFQVHDKGKPGFKETIDQLIKQAFNIQNDRYISFCKKENLDKFDFNVSLRKLIEHLNNDLNGYYFVSECE